jgi:hypothetical protein
VALNTIVFDISKSFSCWFWHQTRALFLSVKVNNTLFYIDGWLIAKVFNLTASLGLGLWCLMPLSTIFHLYRGKSRTQINHIDGVIIIVLASSAVDLGCDIGLGQTKTYKIGICCF